MATHAFQMGTVNFTLNWIFDNGFENRTREQASADLRAQLFHYGTYEISKNSGTIGVSGQIDDTGMKNLSMRDDKAFAVCFAIGIMGQILERRVPNLPYTVLFPIPSSPLGSEEGAFAAIEDDDS